MLTGWSNSLLGEIEVAVEEEGRCSVSEWPSVTRTEEGWGCLDSGEMQTLKDLFDGCEHRFFLEADLRNVISA